jgi:uncharacterized membrane protein YhdT
MRKLRQFGRFWYDFLVGDDWTIAVAVVAAVGVTAALAQTGYPAWFVMPVAVLAILCVSMYRAVASRR